MRSLASLAAALLAATSVVAQTPPLPPEAGTPSGPVGTAGAGASARYDGVARAAVDPALTGLSVATAAVPPGEHVEVTALSNGRTVLLPVVVGTSAALSPAAARLLGIDASAGVRIRAVTAGPADANALRQGQAASPRLDTPEAVLRALRRQLPAAVAAAPARGMRVPKAPAAPGRRVDNTVADVAPPPPTSLKVDPAAQAARDDAVARGYADAAIFIAD